MKYIYKAGMLCFLSALYYNHSFGQGMDSDTAYLNNISAQLVKNYNKSVSEQSRLYSGREYLPYDPSIKGDAYYPSSVTIWFNGEVNYDGIVYKDIPLMYDVYKDVVISLLYNKFSKYILLSERVHDFTFFNHHFVRIDADSLKNDKSGISTGFYDQLYNGKNEVLVKRSKEIQNNSSSFGLETFFLEKHEYYVKTGNTYYKISSQGSFLNLLKDKKADLKQYIRANKIRFKKDPESAMTKIAAYYDSITH
jgi:hypothetical protein